MNKKTPETIWRFYFTVTLVAALRAVTKYVLYLLAQDKVRRRVAH